MSDTGSEIPTPFSNEPSRLAASPESVYGLSNTTPKPHAKTARIQVAKRIYFQESLWSPLGSSDGAMMNGQSGILRIPDWPSWWRGVRSGRLLVFTHPASTSGWSSSWFQVSNRNQKIERDRSGRPLRRRERPLEPRDAWIARVGRSGGIDQAALSRVQIPNDSFLATSIGGIDVIRQRGAQQKNGGDEHDRRKRSESRPTEQA